MTELTVSVAGMRTLLEQITEVLAEVAGHLAEMEAELVKLQDEGIFDELPTPSWEGRNGQGRYLRLIYPMRGRKRRRVYVGCKPERVMAALATIERTRRFLALGQEIRRVNSRLRRAHGSLTEALARLQDRGW